VFRRADTTVFSKAKCVLLIPGELSGQTWIFLQTSSSLHSMDLRSGDTGENAIGAGYARLPGTLQQAAAWIIAEKHGCIGTVLPFRRMEKVVVNAAGMFCLNEWEACRKSRRAKKACPKTEKGRGPLLHSGNVF